MTNYSRKTIKIEGQIISYLDSSKMESEKPTLVFLHGWGVEAASWHQQLDFFTEQGFRVLALDFPGFGQSQLPQQPFSVFDYAQLTSAWLKSLQIDNYILIGHSFGGRVIIRGYEEFFSKAKSIVLTGSAGLKDKSFSLTAKKKAGQTLGNIKKLPLIGSIAEQFARRFRSSDYQNLHGVMAETFKKVIDEDLHSYLAKLKLPTLLIWGSEDDATPIDDAYIFEELISNSKLVVFDKVGHFAFLEKSEEFNQEILLFLTDDK